VKVRHGREGNAERVKKGNGKEPYTLIIPEGGNYGNNKTL
jgi:hypothetical protein